MGLKQNYGNLFHDGRVVYQSPTSGTTPLSIIIPGAENFDNFGFQLITEDAPRTVIVTGTDHVVAATRTWTFANAAFTAADVGGSITVAGATNAGNNGTFPIASVTSGTVVVTTGGTQVDETFSASVTLVVTKKTVAGVWTLQASNSYNDGGMGFGAVAAAGSWPDATSLLNATPTAVSAPSDQYRQLQGFGGRALRLTLTPSTGSALVTVYCFAKSNG